MDLSRFPRRRYSDGPTPIAFLPRFGVAPAQTCPGGRGPRIWIKRDDLLGPTPDGTKTRTLEFLARRLRNSLDQCGDVGAKF